MRKYMILFGILFLIILSYSVNADWHSSTFGASVEVTSTPESSNPVPANKSTDVSIDIGEWKVTISDDDGDYTNGTITCDNGDTDSWTQVGDGEKSLTLTTLSYETNYTIWLNFTDGTNDVNETYWFITGEPTYTWHNASFGASVEVLDIPINTSIAPTTWIAGSSNVGTSVQENFTFYQNGSSNLDITIGINTTNFSFVDYTTYDSSGYNQICANFTTDSWSSETNIADTSYPFSTSLQSNFAPGNFTFGVRIWMPKMLDAENVDENFKLILSSSEHT